MRARGLNGIAVAATSLLATLLAGGCVTTGDTTGGVSTPSAPSRLEGSGGSPGSQEAVASAELTPAEKRMREQSQAFQKTVWQGALFGAGSGVLWAIIQGDDTKDILKNALIGDAVGGFSGTYIAHKQEQYSNKEDQLDSMIADVRESNEDTEALIASVRQVIDEDKRRLASVQKQVTAGTATDAQLNAVRNRISDNQAVVDQASKGAREKYRMFQGAEQEFSKRNPGTDTSRLQSELKAYNQQIETLDGLAHSISVA